MPLLAAESARNRRNVIESNSDAGARACTRARRHRARKNELVTREREQCSGGGQPPLFFLGPCSCSPATPTLLPLPLPPPSSPSCHDRPLFFRASHAREYRPPYANSREPPCSPVRSLPHPLAARVSFVRRRGANPHDATPPITPS